MIKVTITTELELSDDQKKRLKDSPEALIATAKLQQKAIKVSMSSIKEA